MWETIWRAMAAASWLDWLLLAGAVLGALWCYGTWTYDHWSRRGVPNLRPPVPFLGTSWRMFCGLRSIPDEMRQLYVDGAPHRAFGIFSFRQPTLVLRDPALVRHIAIKAFDHFPNHNPPFNGDGDSFLTKNLVVLRDQQWRDMRGTLSPAFTTSKLKGMAGLMGECAAQLADHVKEQLAKGEGGGAVKLDAKELATRYANDVIATAAFGVRCDSLRQPDNRFYAMGMRLSNLRFIQLLIMVGYIICSSLMQALGLRLFDRTAVEFFEGVVLDTIRERQQRGIHRPDMLQLLMQAREGQLKADKDDEHETALGKCRLEDEDVTAQAMIFFFAGFETVSTALSFCVYALATHRDVQQRAQREVDEALDAAAGAPLSYDDVQALKYLDMVVSEAMRLYAPAPLLDRECAAACQLPAESGEPDIILRRGDRILIPLQGLHLDPEYWPEPQTFDPERFSDENKANIKPFTYMPFGVGPRICIGQRFALLELKLALVHLLANFDLSRPDAAPGPMQYAKSLKLAPKDGHITHFSVRAK